MLPLNVQEELVTFIYRIYRDAGKDLLSKAGKKNFRSSLKIVSKVKDE